MYIYWELHYIYRELYIYWELHEHPMRDQELLNIPPFRTATGQRTFHYRAVKIWNELEDELKHIPTLGNFKRKLKSHLLDKFHLSS